jgi:hypothetical protein
MEQVEHNPVEGIYPADDYVHAMEVRNPQRILYIAGTMGLRPDGSAGKDIDEQLELVWSNIRTILASADMTVDNVVTPVHPETGEFQWRAPLSCGRHVLPVVAMTQTQQQRVVLAVDCHVRRLETEPRLHDA